MAKELNCISNPLSQVTIEDSRTGWQQEPRYNDVRWSKQLKQDADLIISMFRPSRIDSLVVNQELVRDWSDGSVPYNSVFLKQSKVRHGKQEWKRFHMIHTDKGLRPYSKEHDNTNGYTEKHPFQSG
jgi:replicative DNA helicase